MDDLKTLETSPELLEAFSKSHQMSSKESFEQRVSYVYGQLGESNRLTKDEVRDTLKRLEKRY